MDDIVEDIIRKVEILRRAIGSPDPEAAAPDGRFPPGRAIDTVPQAYLEGFSAAVRSSAVEPRPGIDGRLALPPELVELYRITNGADCGGIEFETVWDGSGGECFAKGDIMDDEGQVTRDDEHWARLARIGNDWFLVDLESGGVMFSDQYFWRYGDPNVSRVLAPDALTFFNEFVVGPKYAEILADVPDPENRWLDDLRRLGVI
jgi:hypothetical protein